MYMLFLYFSTLYNILGSTTGTDNMILFTCGTNKWIYLQNIWLWSPCKCKHTLTILVLRIKSVLPSFVALSLLPLDKTYCGNLITLFLYSHIQPWDLWWGSVNSFSVLPDVGSLLKCRKPLIKWQTQPIVLSILIA